MASQDKPIAAAPLILETDSLRLQIAGDGSLESLVSRHDDAEYVAAAAPWPIAVAYRGGQAEPEFPDEHAAFTGRWVYRGGESFPASRVRLAGDRLRVEFDGAKVRAEYRVTATPNYLAFELLSVEGGPIDRIDFLRLNINRLPHLGQWINAACDDRFGFCLRAGNIRTNAEMELQTDHVVMRATAEVDPGFEGTVAVLFGCREPREKLLDAMATVEREFDLPAGAARRRLPEQRASYLWASRPTPANIGDYIDWAKRGGFRVILFSYNAFSEGAGHFRWNASYPNGMDDLKRVTDAIRGAGLRVGLHIHYCKASRNDAYVTPVPDDRLHHVRSFTLTEPIDAETQTIAVAENPAGCTLDDKRRILKVEDELVEYEDYTTSPSYLFTGCRRGFLGTTPGVHRKGDSLALLDVDTWPKFIRYDQNTDIQDETAQRLADIYRQTGPYELIYFDGAEDVHEPFWYHVASAQHRVYKLLDPAPPVCEAAHYTHFSWHMITRSNAYDIVASDDGMKDFCRLMPCPTAAERVKDFSRIDFGWLGRFGGDAEGCPGPDVFEYVATRAAAWDCPVSLHVSLEEIMNNPRRDDCLAALKTWEDARLEGRLGKTLLDSLKNVRPEHAHYVRCYQQRETWRRCLANEGLTDAQRAILADRREHHLFVNESGDYELAEIEEIPGLCDGLVKAFSFKRTRSPGTTFVLVWSIDDDVRLEFSPRGPRPIAMRPFGESLPLAITGDTTVVSVGNRLYLGFPDTTRDEVEEILRSVKCSREYLLT
ncbi:MAG: hypothetical protein GXP25_02375 [Planctomycetes bacterium]|nr:hypothetical protein [Planctomycetota bacterium]